MRPASTFSTIQLSNPRVKKRRLFSKSLEKDTKQHATGQQNFKLSINNRGKL